MPKHGWIWLVCSLMLVGCLPKALTPMTSILNTPTSMVSTSTSTSTASIPVSSMPITSTPMTPDPYPQALVINEYLLSAPPDISTEQLGFQFADGDQKEIMARSEAYRDFGTQISEYNSRALAPFGYSLKDYQKSDYGTSHWYSFIYHGDEMIAQDVMFITPISVNASGTDFIGSVDLFNGTYVLTRDSFEKRLWPPGREPYVYVGDQLLSVEISTIAMRQELVSVYLDDNLAYQTEVNAASTYGTFDVPWSYNNHWALVLLDAKLGDNQEDWKMIDRVIQDGQDINEVKGYEQSFQFAVLDSRPFFFYQKNGKIGISFDGQEIDKEYDEIPHYNCCSPAMLNPRISMNMVWFFAQRDGKWYYVEAYIPE